MKIAIIGTSNSVMKRGYVEALSTQHEILDLSIGRVPIFYHISAVLKQAEHLKSCDIIVIEHYINDVNIYFNTMPDYELHAENYYKLLASLGLPVVNILFPIYKIEARATAACYHFVKALSEHYGFTTADLNTFTFERRMFQDVIHLRRETAYVIGLVLAAAFQAQLPAMRDTTLPGLGELPAHPYRLISAQDLVTRTGEQLKRFENSRVSLEYLPLSPERAHEIIPALASGPCKATSIGYINISNELFTGDIGIDGRIIPFSVGGHGYYHELLNERPVCRERLDISGGRLDAEYPSLVGRFTFLPADAERKGLNFCDLLLYGGTGIDDVPRGKGRALDLPDLPALVDKTFAAADQDTLNDKDINMLRDVAIAIEGFDLRLSLQLMSLAKQCRPMGPSIARKVAQYNRKLRQKQ